MERWEAVTREGFAALHRGGYYREAEARKAYESIRRQLWETFGPDETYLAYLQKMQMAAGEWADYASGEKWKKTLAEVHTLEAEAMLPKTSGPFPEAVALMSRAVGFGLNPSTITIAEFFGYSNSMRSWRAGN